MSCFGFFNSHVDDLVYELNTDMLLSERAQGIPYLLLAKSRKKAIEQEDSKKISLFQVIW